MAADAVDGVIAPGPGHHGQARHSSLTVIRSFSKASRRIEVGVLGLRRCSLRDSMFMPKLYDCEKLM
jgi:hypothetical protein